MKSFKFLKLAIALIVTSLVCESPLLAQGWKPADPEATPEAVQLMQRLQRLQQKGIMYGHHEHSGSFFWWGRTRCEDEEYAELWRYTVNYLRQKGLHQILYAYNTDKVYSPEEYMQGYPGDEYIDMLSVDWYGQGEEFNRNAENAIRFISDFSAQKRKPFALSECGPISSDLLKFLAKYPCSYLLTWRHAPLRGRTPRGIDQHKASLKAMMESPRYLFHEETK